MGILPLPPQTRPTHHDARHPREERHPERIAVAAKPFAAVAMIAVIRPRLATDDGGMLVIDGAVDQVEDIPADDGG